MAVHVKNLLISNSVCYLRR